MNNQPLISIVVPVYNAELYLADCLDSLLGQTYPFYEIILIDDGSTDHSATLIKRYSAEQTRIKAFYQPNSGVSVSRNRAIGYSKGDYLTFVDADDRVGQDYLKSLLAGLSEIKRKGVVIGGLEHVYPNEDRRRVEVPNKEYRHEEFGKLFSEINLHHYWYAASKLYDLSLIRERELFFEEQLSYAEDALFLMNYLKWADFVRFCPGVDYFYIQHPGTSLSRTNRSYLAEFSVFIQMKKHLNEIIHQNSDMKESLPLMYNEISIYLIRALPALYRPPFALSRSERLHAIEGLTEEDYKLLKANHHPKRLLDKIGKTLLLNRQFKFYDWYMNTIFYIRYRFMSKSNQ